MGRYFAVIFILAACTVQWCASSSCCETFWMQRGSFCYRVIGSPLNWLDAGTACRNYGGELASIQDGAENTFVYDLWRTQTRSPSGGFWIGLHDRYTEGLYQWSDGTEVTYSNWDPKQPDNKNNEDCIHIIYGSLQWNDADCGTGLSYICKKAL
ncbi:alpha-N-acetylgalactosamine-specific lectin-like [Diadema setosum]|uniref:alpha-N-acetylgalactosamine-specific lectin-like n=1 Tax=Diadema setosum TaxID=31175 RepID=UPI003B3BA2BC